MKHGTFEAGTGLPDAPLHMPRQVLERSRWLPGVWRQLFLVWQRR